MKDLIRYEKVLNYVIETEKDKLNFMHTKRIFYFECR
jgi:hypothetical protein